MDPIAASPLAGKPTAEFQCGDLGLGDFQSKVEPLSDDELEVIYTQLGSQISVTDVKRECELPFASPTCNSDDDLEVVYTQLIKSEEASVEGASRAKVEDTKLDVQSCFTQKTKVLHTPPRGSDLTPSSKKTLFSIAVAGGASKKLGDASIRDLINALDRNTKATREMIAALNMNK